MLEKVLQEEGKGRASTFMFFWCVLRVVKFESRFVPSCADIREANSLRTASGWMYLRFNDPVRAVHPFCVV